MALQGRPLLGTLHPRLPSQLLHTSDLASYQCTWEAAFESHMETQIDFLSPGFGLP